MRFKPFLTTDQTNWETTDGRDDREVGCVEQGMEMFVSNLKPLMNLNTIKLNDR